MRTNLYLIVNSRGTARVVKRKYTYSPKLPALKEDEVAVALEVSLPESLFKKPQLQATVNVPEEAVRPNVIDAEVVDNIKEAIRSVTGVEMSITVQNQNESTA